MVRHSSSKPSSDMTRKVRRCLLPDVQYPPRPNFGSRSQVSTRLHLSTKNSSNDIFRLRNQISSLSGFLPPSRAPRRAPPNLVSTTSRDETSKIMSLEAIVGYHFKNPSLLKEAMQTPGFQTKGSSGLRNQRSTASFPVDCDHRRLAIIGDKVLGLALASDWYSGGGSRSKGTSTLLSLACSHLFPKPPSLSLNQ